MQELVAVHVSEIASSEDFYMRFGRRPLLIEGCFEDNPFLKKLTFSYLKESLRGHHLRVLHQGIDSSWILSENFFLNFSEEKCPTYILEHPISQTPFKDQVNTPSFLGENWYASLPSGVATNLGTCLHVAKKGTKTPWHEDYNGTQGWLLFASGKKQWTFLPPVVPDFTKENFGVVYDYRDQREDALQVFTKAGQFLFIPPGWSHKVETFEDSIGLSTYHMNEYLIKESVDEILCNRVRWGLKTAKGYPIMEDFITGVLKIGRTSEAGRLIVEAQLKRLKAGVDVITQRKHKIFED